MKTINNAQKTENKNFKNTTFRTLAVVASLVLISLTVDAGQNHKPTTAANTYDGMAALKTDRANVAALPVSAQPTGEIMSNAWLFETAKEAELRVESWMTGNKYFGFTTLNNEISAEKNLEIESWMIDNPYFSNPKIESDTEAALQIESWMTSETLWKASR